MMETASKTKAKFTFKKEPKATGLQAVGYSSPNTTIKHDGKEVGTISAPTWKTEDHKWSIRLMVVKVDERAGFTWKTVKQKFDVEPDARKFLIENAKSIIALGLHHFED